MTTAFRLRGLKRAVTISPPDVAGLKAWWKADSLVLSNNDPVSTWVDSSAQTNDVTAAGATRPTYKTNIQNSLSIVRFTAATPTWMATGNSPTTPTGLAALTAFFVGTRGTGNPRRAMGHQSSGSGWVWGVGTAVTTGSFVTINVFEYAVANVWTAADTFYVMSVVLDASQDVEMWRNGASIGTSANNAFGNNPTSSPFEIGSFNAGSEPWNGDIGEVILYDGALTTGNRHSLEQYLGSKWGITIA